RTPSTTAVDPAPARSPPPEPVWSGGFLMSGAFLGKIVHQWVAYGNPNKRYYCAVRGLITPPHDLFNAIGAIFRTAVEGVFFPFWKLSTPTPYAGATFFYIEKWARYAWGQEYEIDFSR